MTKCHPWVEFMVIWRMQKRTSNRPLMVNRRNIFLYGRLLIRDGMINLGGF